jgi:multidrug efflux pump subunit AcrB
LPRHALQCASTPAVENRAALALQSAKRRVSLAVQNLIDSLSHSVIPRCPAKPLKNFLKDWLSRDSDAATVAYSLRFSGLWVISVQIGALRDLSHSKLAILAFTSVQSGFMPAMDEGGFIVDYQAPPGTSLAETDRLVRQVEAILHTLPEVQSYSRRTGLGLGGDLN